MKKSLAVIEEKDKIRGLVPARSEGRKDKVYAQYLEALDPRNNEKVQIALAECPDVRFQEFLERINMPKYGRVGLQTIAKACGIDLLQFNNWWQKASTQQAIATAQVGSVRIAEDLVQDAQTKDVVCERCEGLKFVAAPEGLWELEIPGYKEISTDPKNRQFIRDCPACNGTGKTRKIGDAHARDRVLEMSGIIQRGKAAVSIVQNFGGASHSSAVTQLDEAMTLDAEFESVPSGDDDPVN